MGHEVMLIQNGKKTNITPLIGSLAWSSNIDALGDDITFNYAYNDSPYFKQYDMIREGDIVALLNQGKVIKHYVVVQISTSGRFGKSITGFDFGWYLNKNKVVIQFKKASASDAIRKLCDKVGIKHDIVAIPTLITKIYKDEAVSDVIKELLDQAKQETGVTYRMEMVDQTLTIKKLTDLVINPKIKLADNTGSFPAALSASNATRTTSIDDLRNRVVVVTSEESTKVYAEASDSVSIKKYGLLSENVSVDAKNKAQARNIAKNTLKDLNRIKEELTLDLLGSDEIKAGRLIDMDVDTIGVKGRYIITSANHSEANGIHRVTVQLGAS